jgi:hypothetical protein
MTDMDIDVDLAGPLQAIDDLQERYAGDGAAWVVGTRVNYAVYVNFGTRNQDPQPFFSSAVAEAQADLAGFVAANTRTTVSEADSAEELVKTVALALERRMKELAPVDTGTLRASIAAVPAEAAGRLPDADEIETDASGAPIDPAAAASVRTEVGG